MPELSIPPRQRLALLAAAAALLGACSREIEISTPRASREESGRTANAAVRAPIANVLLVSLDTTRRDRLGFAGGRAATPHLDALAGEGAVCVDAYAPTPITLPSHASLLTGAYPPRHGVRDNGIFELGPRATTLAEILREAGFRTGAVVAGFVLDGQFGLAQGFDEYDDRFESGGGGTLGVDERNASDVTGAALAWLDQKPSGRFFLFAHYFDAHFPYVAPAEIAASQAEPYEAEIAYVDRELGRLFAGLRARNAFEKTLVVVTADHGESLGEHGEKTHGIFVYQSTQAIPLLFRGPGIPAGRRISGAVSLVDVVPTVLELLDLPLSADVQGQSLAAALLQGAPIAPRAIYLESLLGRYSFGWAPLAAIVRDGWKLVDAPCAELFDLAQDPQERANLFEREPDRARSLAAELAALRARLRADGGSFALSRAPGEAARARLAALGYVSEPLSSGGANARDPKDALPEMELLERAGAAQEQGLIAEALRLYDEILAIDPRHAIALQRSGVALLDLERLREGVERLERVDPLQLPAEGPMFRLAAAQAQLGNTARALDLFSELRRRNPKYVLAHVFFAQLEEAAGRPREAVAAYREALAHWHGEAAFRTRIEQRIRELESR